MGRRSDHTAPELQELLIAAAEQIVAREGIAQLSVRKVTHQIGYTPGTLYQHFAGIADLLLHVNARTLDRLAETLRNGDITAPAAARLHNFARLYLGFIRANTQLWAALFQLTLPPGTPVPDWYLPRIETLITMVADTFADLGLTTPRARREAAEMIWSSIHAVCSLDTSGKLPLVSRRPLEQLIDDLVAIHIAGHQAQNAQRPEKA